MYVHSSFPSPRRPAGPSSSTINTRPPKSPPSSRVMTLPHSAAAAAAAKKKAPQNTLWSIISAPKRAVLSPPSKSSATPSGLVTDHSLKDVTLADVVDDVQLSPISLREFEGYLVFKEHSAENLYCLLWLNQYTQEYTEWIRSPSPRDSDSSSTDSSDSFDYPAPSHHLPAYLRESLQRGLAAFFYPDAPLELNLSALTREKTIHAASTTGNPDAFAEARTVIELSLNRSLSLFTSLIGC